MSQLIAIYDDGFTKDRKGRTVSAIRFRIVTGEGKPDDIQAHCLPAYKDAVIKNLRRLAFPNQQEQHELTTDTLDTSNNSTINQEEHL